VTGDALLRNPISGAFDDFGATPPGIPVCARTPSGHADTAAPSTVIKSRRLMSLPRLDTLDADEA
jgi:hypothetical protein